jgi:hypothetical protein
MNAGSFRDLQAALSRLDEAPWHQSADPHGDVVTWLPLWLYSQSGLWLGLDTQARWVLGRMSGPVAVEDGQLLSQSWLPVLDHNQLTADRELSCMADRFRLPVEPMLSLLPVDDVIALALSSSSAHWIERGLAWLESRDVRDDIRELLPAVASSSVAGQRARHTASRLLKRLEDPGADRA